MFFEVIHGNAFLRFYRGDLCNRCSEAVPPDCKVFDVFELVFASERRAKVHHDLGQLDILASRRLHDSFVVYDSQTRQRRFSVSQGSGCNVSYFSILVSISTRETLLLAANLLTPVQALPRQHGRQ
jgi:hypothetical protein